MSKKVVVIGAGFSGLSSAAVLAHKGYEVTLIEKNNGPGGRGRKFEEDGFVFDMGPSWYWMPDVFEKFFELFNKKPSDYYQLIRLDPSYKIFYDNGYSVEIPADLSLLKRWFESIEPGSSQKLDEFLLEAEYKYKVAINSLVYKPGRRLSELLDSSLLKGLFKLSVFKSIGTHIRQKFKDPRLIKLLEFPVLFLGAMPNQIPSLYSLMNYADIVLGTWYPLGGMHKVAEALERLALEQGVEIIYNTEAIEILTKNKTATSVVTNRGKLKADIVVGTADYNHIDQKLLSEKARSYSAKYWDSRTLAPSSLIFYLGINKKLKNLLHHNLFFDEDLNRHGDEIYKNPQWPTKPLFYVCVTSKTDKTVAPDGCENLFVLIPVAPGLVDNLQTREKYFSLIMDRLEKQTGEKIREHIIYKRSYAHHNFIEDYNSYKGNAYGLANTLMQTAHLKPSIKSKKLKNLFFAGQLTVPGPGVPPALISGQVVANEIEKEFKI